MEDLPLNRPASKKEFPCTWNGQLGDLRVFSLGNNHTWKINNQGMSTGKMKSKEKQHKTNGSGVVGWRGENGIMMTNSASGLCMFIWMCAVGQKNTWVLRLQIMLRKTYAYLCKLIRFVTCIDWNQTWCHDSSTLFFNLFRCMRRTRVSYVRPTTLRYVKVNLTGISLWIYSILYIYEGFLKQ